LQCTSGVAIVSYRTPPGRARRMSASIDFGLPRMPAAFRGYLNEHVGAIDRALPRERGPFTDIRPFI
jgi:hypothetical protein